MKSHEIRLKEAIATLETLRDELTLTRADLWQAEQRSDKAVANAKKKEKQELDQWMLSEQCYTEALQQWQREQSQEAIAALERKKAWPSQLVILLACLLSGGLFLIVETREIQRLQSWRDHPPFGEDQRLWSRNLQDAQRKVAYLRSLRGPRVTPEMREAQQEVFSLRKKRDMLEHQILLQETRVNVLLSI
jgi:hypothetical protein